MSSQKTQASEAKITLVVDFFGGCTVYFAANNMLLKMPKTMKKSFPMLTLSAGVLTWSPTKNVCLRKQFFRGSNWFSGKKLSGKHPCFRGLLYQSCRLTVQNIRFELRWICHKCVSLNFFNFKIVWNHDTVWNFQNFLRIASKVEAIFDSLGSEVAKKLHSLDNNFNY